MAASEPGWDNMLCAPAEAAAAALGGAAYMFAGVALVQARKRTALCGRYRRRKLGAELRGLQAMHGVGSGSASGASAALPGTTEATTGWMSILGQD